MSRLRLLSLAGFLVSVPLILVAVAITLELFGLTEAIGLTEPTDPGVALATAGLAIFIGVLFFAEAVAARVGLALIVGHVEAVTGDFAPALALLRRRASVRAGEACEGGVRADAPGDREAEDPSGPTGGKPGGA